jgi:anti-anti-sigma factor
MAHGLSDQTESTGDELSYRALIPMPRHFRWPATASPGPAQVTARTFAPREVVLEIAGEIDLLTAPLLEAALRGQLAAAPRIVVLDLQGITFFGVSGISVLLAANDEVPRSGGSLRLVRPSVAVARPLVGLGLAGRFDIYDGVLAALAA